jgi:hypothetical protein
MTMPSEQHDYITVRSRIDPVLWVREMRDKAHLRFVASQSCLICGRQPSDPHHLRFAQPRALGLKVSDEFTVPRMTRPPYYLATRSMCCQQFRENM